MRGRAALASASKYPPINTLSARGSGTHVDSTAIGAFEEGDAIVAANELAIGRTVAIVIGANSLLVHIAVGTLGDGAEIKLLQLSELVRHADREGGGRVAEDAIGSAAGGCGPARGCGCKAKDGGEADQD